MKPRPLPAGKMLTSLTFFSRLRGCLSSLVKLQLARKAHCRVEAILRLMHVVKIITDSRHLALNLTLIF